MSAGDDAAYGARLSLICAGLTLAATFGVLVEDLLVAAIVLLTLTVALLAFARAEHREAIRLRRAEYHERQRLARSGAGATLVEPGREEPTVKHRHEWRAVVVPRSYYPLGKSRAVPSQCIHCRRLRFLLPPEPMESKVERDRRRRSDRRW